MTLKGTMLGTKSRPAVALLALACCVLCGAARPPAQRAGSRRHRIAYEGRADKRTADYGGVSLSYDASLESEAKGETLPASALQEATDKPGGVAPEHVAFKLVGPYASRNRDSHFQPEIHVYPVEGFKETYAVAPQYAAAIDGTVRDLRRALAGRPATFKGEAPYIDFVDAHQAFRAHVHYLNFRGGKGVAFLTEYVFEPTLISDRGLTYFFQGLTDDGRFYVSATFPVAAPSLPAEATDEATDRLYKRACQTCPQYGAYYRAYIKRISRALERTPPRRFEPSLTTLDSMLGSLRVRDAEPGGRGPSRPE